MTPEDLMHFPAAPDDASRRPAEHARGRTSRDVLRGAIELVGALIGFVLGLVCVAAHAAVILGFVTVAFFCVGVLATLMACDHVARWAWRAVRPAVAPTAHVLAVLALSSAAVLVYVGVAYPTP